MTNSLSEWNYSAHQSLGEHGWSVEQSRGLYCRRSSSMKSPRNFVGETWKRYKKCCETNEKATLLTVIPWFQRGWNMQFFATHCHGSVIEWHPLLLVDFNGISMPLAALIVMINSWKNGDVFKIGCDNGVELRDFGAFVDSARAWATSAFDQCRPPSLKAEVVCYCTTHEFLLHALALKM